LSCLLDLLNSIAVGAGELLSDGVESVNSATCGIQSTTNSTVRASLLIYISDEILLVAASLICNGLGGALREELDCGVGRDALLFGGGLRVGGFGINLGNQYSRLSDEVCGKSFPSWSKRLSMSTPWCCECHKNILVLANLFRKALIIQHGHGAGDLALNLWLQTRFVRDPFAQTV